MTTTREVAGTPDGTGLRVAIVAARFNEEIVDGLIDGAVAALGRVGVLPDAVTVYRVPGAFEIPQALEWVLEQEFGRVDAVICLGAVIRGGTPHFEYVSSAVTRGVGELALHTAVAVSFGVLTTDTVEQAAARSSDGPANKGAEAALAAVEMVTLRRAITARSRPQPQDGSVTP
ncbi:MAG: 6,7-dimethyl-8-ribityllumazine synthase [Myxococcales bacterium]|nr:6,7-dimethyl-8-ribityllumazine synthase [Myxococcales bacterium]